MIHMLAGQKSKMTIRKDLLMKALCTSYKMLATSVPKFFIQIS